MADMKAFMAAKRAREQQDANQTAAPVADQAQVAAPTQVVQQPEVHTPTQQAAPAPVNAFAARFKATAQPAKPVAAPAEQLVDESMDLSNLANLDVTETAQVRETRSQFADETPATKPTREIPEGADKAHVQFIDLIDGVYEIVGDPELLGSVIKNIMIELQRNPQYMKLVAKDDVRLWVKSMRDSMGLARIKKQESKTKRATGAASKKGGKVDNDMLDAFNDLGINTDDL